jgi:hypothetical protein
VFGFKRLDLMANPLRKAIWGAALITAFVAVPVQSAKYSGEFLNLGAGGRPLALGGAFMAAEGGVLSGYYNPAGLSLAEKPQAIFMHSESFGSLLNHDFLACSWPLQPEGKKAALGISLYRLGGGGIYVTGVDQNDRFYVIREESHADYAAYFSYGRQFSDRFYGGITTKFIYRDIVDESAFGIGIDLGSFYSPRPWISFGVALQDISTTLLSYSTGKKESIVPTVRLGSSLNSRRGDFGGAVYVDGETRFEGRDYAAQLSAGGVSIDSHFGLEIDYRQVIFGRIGSDVGNLTLGAGLRVNKLNIDLAMRNHSELDNTFLASITFGL